MNLTDLKKLSKNRSLLYIEDDTFLREKTSGIFNNLFNEVNTAQDGVDGLASYKKYFDKENKYYDIVVTDIQMPRLDGIFESDEKDKRIIGSLHIYTNNNNSLNLYIKF